MNHGIVQRGGYEAERVFDAPGQGQSLAAEPQSILGISEQPIGLRTKVAGARARVVPAVEPPKQMVPFGIIKPAPRLAVLASSRGRYPVTANDDDALVGLDLIRPAGAKQFELTATPRPYQPVSRQHDNQEL
jgi:hypothetical protein